MRYLYDELGSQANVEEVALCWDYGFDKEEVIAALETKKFSGDSALTEKQKTICKLHKEKKFHTPFLPSYLT
jgi:hypothetical protein